jgi:hypothetical protein
VRVNGDRDDPSEATRGARAVRDGPKYGGRRGGAPGGTEEAREFRIWRETGLPIHATIPRSLAAVTASGKFHPLYEVGLLETSGIRSITDLKGKRHHHGSRGPPSASRANLQSTARSA